LAGNFNEEPQNKPISKIMSPSFEDLYTLIFKGLPQPSQKKHPDFTTYKIRKEKGLK